MIFSSTAFLLIFLPIALGAYFLTPKKFRNLTLCAISILFYLCNDPIMFPFLCLLIGITYACIKVQHKKSHFVISISFLVFLMAYLKYYSSFLTTFNFGNPQMIFNPLGYSFILFSLISVVIDAYRDKTMEIDFFTYVNFVMFFPKIFMGPLMRYADFSQQWKHHPTTTTHLHKGAMELVKGCFLKAVMANTFASIFTLCSSSTTMLAAWMMLFAYGFQLYFDFYGYTCMAQGISMFFGFKLPKNFKNPYLASSIQNFWTRWHISLSTWFKDYLYIPLGGNRHGTIKTIRNLLIVWLATGMWHGSTLPYIGWGLYHGTLVLCERFIFKNVLKKLPRFITQVSTFILVLFGWIAFYQSDLDSCIRFITQLFNFSHIFDVSILGLFTQYLSVFLIGTVLISKIPSILYQWAKAQYKDLFVWIEFPIFISMWILIFLYLIADSYQAFLYFQF